MKRRVLNIIGFSLMAITLLAARPGRAQTTGPYYPIPSWNQTFPCTSSTNCPRFVSLVHAVPGGVALLGYLDRDTGLVWEGDPRRRADTWLDAQDDCNKQTTGGRRGWRLPTIQELASLVEPSPFGEFFSLPPGHPFMNVFIADLYWSATTSARDANKAWVIQFSSFINDGIFVDTKTPVVGPSLRYRVWCVRGGQGVDPQ
jgi:hypothetical protein